MNRKKMPSFALGFMAGLLLVATTQLQAAVQLQVSPDRKTALYKMGEAASFTIRVTDNGQAVTAGSLTYLVDNFLDVLTPRTGVALAADGAVVKVESSKPQFLRCVVTYKPPSGNPVT
ncbi:MAG: hypothetical protein ABGX05_20585, partial [Pirellulaceae bacterium]